jgi:hypothetical protein
VNPLIGGLGMLSAKNEPLMIWLTSPSHHAARVPASRDCLGCDTGSVSTSVAVNGGRCGEPESDLASFLRTPRWSQAVGSDIALLVTGREFRPGCSQPVAASPLLPAAI